MSKATDGTAEAPIASADVDPTDVLEGLDGAMDEALYNGTEGRVRSAENERVRIEWLRTFVDAATEYRRLRATLTDESVDGRA